MREILNKLINNGFEAFVVGGYVRDYLLSLKSYDIDICTNAKIEDIINIFNGIGKVNKEYYSYHIEKDNITYAITSYRKELEYYKNKPIKLEYASSLEEDLLRRDFTINTLAMDIDGNIIDLLDAKEDLNNKIIKVVGDTYNKFNEDKTRIIRALRFSTVLDFKLDKYIDDFLNKNASLLKEVPKEYIKKELDKIFSNKNYLKFFEMVDKYNLKPYLNINYSNIKPNCDKMEVWAQLDTTLPLSNKEIKICNAIKGGYYE